MARTADWHDPCVVRRRACSRPPGWKEVLERSVMEATDLIVLTPAGCLDPSPAIAACRAGARGTLDLQFTDDTNRAVAAIERLAAFGGPRFGVKLGSNAKVLTQA